jgi:hypothetical protein
MTPAGSVSTLRSFIVRRRWDSEYECSFAGRLSGPAKEPRPPSRFGWRKQLVAYRLIHGLDRDVETGRGGDLTELSAWIRSTWGPIPATYGPHPHNLLLVRSNGREAMRPLP